MFVNSTMDVAEILPHSEQLILNIIQVIILMIGGIIVANFD